MTSRSQRCSRPCWQVVLSSSTPDPGFPYRSSFFPLLLSLTYTFALTRLFIGHLNVISGFLVAILMGLGIDYGIHLYIRFKQELLKGKTIAEADGTSCDPGRTVRAYSDADDDKCFFNFKLLRFSGFFRVRKNCHAGYRQRFFELLFSFFRHRHCFMTKSIG